MTDPQSRARLRILLVEDHIDIATNVIDSFEREEHTMDFASSVATALSLLRANSYDVLVVDIMLESGDGIELCAKIRQQRLSAAPILMLTARSDVDDKVSAFDAGADDYVTKPFAMRELLARCEVLSRRGMLTRNTLLSMYGIELDTADRTVVREDSKVQLTPTGYQILLTLMRAAPAVLLRDDLEQAVWGDDRPDSDALRTHLSVLRAAIDKPFDTPLIHTVHGAGWKLSNRT